MQVKVFLFFCFKRQGVMEMQAALVAAADIHWATSLWDFNDNELH